MAIADIHERIRDAMAAAFRPVAASLGINIAYTQNVFESNRVDLPCVVFSYDIGTEQVRGGTNRRDDIAYPVLAGFYTSAPVNDESQQGGPVLTRFRDSIRGLFHLKPLEGVEEVWQCEIVPQPIVQPMLPQYEKLATAVGIIAIARVERANTWSD